METVCCCKEFHGLNFTTSIGCVPVRQTEDNFQHTRGSTVPVYKTAAGEPAAYVEPSPSNLELKIIR